MNITIERIDGRGIPLRGNDIDTDRIIPARYLKEITFTNMGSYLFYDERFDEMGQKKEHILNVSRFFGGSILLVNKNFGCGSSREHAAHSIQKFGIRAIIGESFSNIFASNCLSLGIPVVQVSSEDSEFLMTTIERHPQTVIVISISKGEITCSKKIIKFTMPEHAITALLAGNWNSTQLLLSNMFEVRTMAVGLPYIKGF
ncbi:MAG: 3-isopropylmalate dehydratase small subunit [Candidatus Micrarchaeota archaeon]